MSTCHYSPSGSAAASETYVRGHDDARGVVITCDVPGPPGSWSAAARALAEANHRPVQALHYRQSFSKDECDPKNRDDLQRVNELGYELAKRMHPHADALVVTHIDGKGGHPHNHILVTNHDRETGRALENYRTFRDRPDQGGQKGVQSANDGLMRDHRLSVARESQPDFSDWEIRREDFAEDGLDRLMGDRMQAALTDPGSVDEDGLRAVLQEQNEQVDEYGDRVPRMRLVTSKNKETGRPIWTLKIQDKRDGSRRAERRALCSRLSADFTPEGAQAFFDHHQQMKEQDDERRTREAQAAERARREAGHFGSAGHVDLKARRRRAAARHADEGRAGPDRAPEDHGRGNAAAVAALAGPAVDLNDLRRRLREDRESRDRAAEDLGAAGRDGRGPRRPPALWSYDGAEAGDDQPDDDRGFGD